MKLLITGAAGLLGVQVIERLKTKHELISVVRNPSASPDETLTYCYCDLSTDFDTTHWPTDVDVMIHLAQSPHYRQFPEKAADVYHVNCTATAKLLDYAVHAQVKHFIYTSTGSVYEPYTQELCEASAVAPTSFYANSKLIGEALVRSYASCFKVSALRLFFLYGPHPDLKHTLINQLIQRVKQGEVISIDGDGEGLVFVPTLTRDVSRCIDWFIDTESEGVFNLANPQSLSLKQVVGAIGRQLNQQPRFVYYPEKKPAVIIPSMQKFQSANPEFRFTPFADGLTSVLSS